MAANMMVCRQTWCYGAGEEVRVLHLDQAAKIEQDIGLVFETSKPTLSATLPPTRPPPPNLCQVALLPNDQAFKCVSLWGPLLFKPPQDVCSILQNISQWGPQPRIYNKHPSLKASLRSKGLCSEGD